MALGVQSYGTPSLTSTGNATYINGTNLPTSNYGFQPNVTGNGTVATWAQNPAQPAAAPEVGTGTGPTLPITPAVNPNAGLISSLNGQLGQLDNQQSIGLGNIDHSYGQAGVRLDDQRNLAERNYNTGAQQNTQSYANNRSGIYNNVHSQANALQRLLGLNGAGNSSAAYEQAPYAAALQGSNQLGQAQQTFGDNQTSLDTNWQDTLRGYGHSKEDLNNQKNNQGNALRASIAQTRASLLDRLQQAQGNTSQQPAINDLLTQITNLGQQYSNPNIAASDINTAAPTLKNYFLNSGQAAAPVAQGGPASDVNPSFLGLLGGQRDQFGNIIQ